MTCLLLLEFFLEQLSPLKERASMSLQFSLVMEQNLPQEVYSLLLCCLWECNNEHDIDCTWSAQHFVDYWLELLLYLMSWHCQETGWIETWRAAEGCLPMGLSTRNHTVYLPKTDSWHWNKAICDSHGYVCNEGMHAHFVDCLDVDFGWSDCRGPSLWSHYFARNTHFWGTVKYSIMISWWSFLCVSCVQLMAKNIFSNS